MNLQKIPALALATALQILPMCRVACVNQAVAPTGFAIVMRWVAGAVALLGSYHAVSGASAAISGVAKWTQPNASGVQAGPVILTPTGTVGTPVTYKIIITTPATTGAQNDYYNYDTLPPGLTLSTNVGGTDGTGAGYITGTPTQSGTYPVTLVAGNTLWPQTVTKAITFTISGGGGAAPPGITSPPVSQIVTAGSNATFTVTATGTAPLSYSWKFNTTPIPGPTSSALVLTNVQSTNAGTYSVTVTNSAGSQGASATLTVNPAATAPSITSQPQSLTLANGAAAAFSVTASGSAPLSYQWLKDGSILSGATTSIYTLASVTTNDAGSYRVVITNSVGSITSSVATLTVQVSATSPLKLGNPQPVGGFWSFVVTGPAQTNYVIWSSTNLSQWSKLTTNFSASGTVQFTDSNALPAAKFYRATVGP